MSVHIANAACETLADFASDAEAVRWFHENGRDGDWLVETGERLGVVSGRLFPHVTIEYDASGCVVATDRAADALAIPDDPFGDLPGSGNLG